MESLRNVHVIMETLIEIGARRCESKSVTNSIVKLLTAVEKLQQTPYAAKPDVSCTGTGYNTLQSHGCCSTQYIPLTQARLNISVHVLRQDALVLARWLAQGLERSAAEFKALCNEMTDHKQQSTLT